MARRSLRTKLIAAVIVAALPALALSAWQAVDQQRNADLRKSETVAATAELAAARYRTLIEGSRRLLEAVCAEDAVRQSANPDARPAEINRCEAYLTNVLGKFPREYSSAFVTDAEGVARCATVPTAVGVGFSDRDIFRLVRDTKAFALGAQVASRVAPRTVIPVALPILQDSAFRGMCAVGISLATIGDLVTPVRTAEHVAVALVDRNGGSIGGDPLATRALPVPARVAAAIVGGQPEFSDFGQDGSFYEFHLLPLANNSIFVVSAAVAVDGWPGLVDAWGGFAAVVLALAGALLVVWLGADRWCMRPLRYIQNFADRIARGEDIELARQSSWAPELASVSDGVRAMAEAIASREAELRAGLEQRDHMLREIHHRVKNNLQMISSLLNLQAGEIRSPRIRRFFGDAQNRVLTLSILHRHLYERSSWALVDFQQFISDLVRQISVGRRAPDLAQPRYHIRAPIMAVGPDIAIPVGLIVTEAVSSALDRSFDGVAAPEIRIEAGDKAGMVELVIEDNGAGPRGAIRPGVRSGFGLTLIRGLAMQLGGEADVSSREGGGTRVSVTFPTPEEPEANA
jgi:two-component sensor histidine kinase